MQFVPNDSLGYPGRWVAQPKTVLGVSQTLIVVCTHKCIYNCVHVCALKEGGPNAQFARILLVIHH